MPVLIFCALEVYFVAKSVSSQIVSLLAVATLLILISRGVLCATFDDLSISQLWFLFFPSILISTYWAILSGIVLL